MQATLDAATLKPFTKALNCLSKYSDDLVVYATPDRLSLSATNSSESAFCRFKYTRHFFSRYNVGKKDDALAGGVEEIPRVTGQLLTKSLLTILKHRTVEKSVERCELSIMEGATPIPNSDRDPEQEMDSLESRLVVRLHCKYGVIKTHRLPLHTATSIHAFDSSMRPGESRLSIGPKALKDMIEHFPSVKGNKGDPQLIWSFGDSEVQIKSLETSIDTKGKTQLATELTISAAEFESYDIDEPPVTLAFQLREFNATVSFADAIQATLNLRFTDPSSPLVIELESDDTESLFAISTSQVQGNPPSQPREQSRQPSSLTSRKRQREEDDRSTTATETSEIPSTNRRSVKVVQRQDIRTAERSLAAADSQRSSRSMPPPSLPLHPSQELEYTQGSPPPQSGGEPLFLPGSQEALRASGLGIEHMTAEEVAEMMEWEGEEFEMPPTQRQDDIGVNEFELFDDTEMEPTQNGVGDSRAFKPLFED